jgi:hypothetical protein
LPPRRSRSASARLLIRRPGLILPRRSGEVVTRPRVIPARWLRTQSKRRSTARSTACDRDDTSSFW